MSKTTALARDVPAEWRSLEGWQRLRFLISLPGLLAIAIPSCLLLDLHQLARGEQS